MSGEHALQTRNRKMSKVVCAEHDNTFDSSATNDAMPGRDTANNDAFDRTCSGAATHAGAMPQKTTRLDAAPRTTTRSLWRRKRRHARSTARLTAATENLVRRRDAANDRLCGRCTASNTVCNGRVGNCIAHNDVSGCHAASHSPFRRCTAKNVRLDSMFRGENTASN
jgi:hypothetical protein